MTTRDNDRTDRVRAAVEAVRAGETVKAAAAAARVQWVEVSTACRLAGVPVRSRGRRHGSTMAVRRAHQVRGKRRVSVQLTHLGEPEFIRVDTSVPGAITLRAHTGDEVAQ